MNETKKEKEWMNDKEFKVGPESHSSRIDGSLLVRVFEFLI